MISSARTYWSLPGTGFTLLILHPSNPHTFLMMILRTSPSSMTQGDKDFVIWLQRYYRTIIKIYSFYSINVDLSNFSIEPLRRILSVRTHFPPPTPCLNNPFIRCALRLNSFHITTKKWWQGTINSMPPFLVGHVSVIFSFSRLSDCCLIAEIL